MLVIEKEQMKPKVRRRKNIVNFRAKVNKMETKKKVKSSMRYALYLSEPVRGVTQYPLCSCLLPASLLSLAMLLKTQGLWDSLPCSRSRGLQALLSLGERRLGKCEVHGHCCCSQGRLSHGHLHIWSAGIIDSAAFSAQFPGARAPLQLGAAGILCTASSAATGFSGAAGSAATVGGSEWQSPSPLVLHPLCSLVFQSTYFRQNVWNFHVLVCQAEETLWSYGCFMVVD